MLIAETTVPLRFGVVRLEHAGAPEPEAEAALSRATALLASTGHLVVPLRLPEICAEAQAAQPILQNYEMAQAMAWEWKAMRHALPPRIGEVLDAAQAIDAAAYDRARGTARQARLAVRDVFRDVDVVLTFAAPGIAPDRATTGDPRFNRLWTLLGVPCAAVPGLRAGRMPVGLQVVGPFARDSATLSAALVLERLLVAEPDL
jgi:Asp-tRNA(Asn)/Glu-tRNA(Gln) amidotransferase A subunit family amidase